jgi:tRNA-modifying protein YgfZ
MSAVNSATSEHVAIAEGAGLVDRSERGKLALTGADAKEFLAGQVTNDVVGLRAGEGCYAALLTPKGRMLGDLRVLDTGDELLLDMDRGALQAIFDVIRRATIGFAVEMHKRTLQRGLLSLAGPRAREIAGAADLPATEHAHRVATIGGAEVRVIATDVGVDVLTLAEDTETVRDALLAAGAEPVSEATLDVLRVETGRPRWGAELDETVIPQEAGLNDRAVSFTKGCYVGQETVARLHWKGKPNRHLRGLRLSAPVPAGAALFLGEREVGRLTSVADSPAHGPIGLALVRREAGVGEVLRVEDGDVTATVAELPFSLPPAA